MTLANESGETRRVLNSFVSRGACQAGQVSVAGSTTIVASEVAGQHSKKKEGRREEEREKWSKKKRDGD